MRKKSIIGKRILAFSLATTMFCAGLGTFGTDNKQDTVHATESETYYFAEGFGTGVDFSEENNSWVIETTFDSAASSRYKNDSGNQAGIVANNHSGNSEPVIRLINGVQNADLNSADSDYRAGTALSTQSIKLNSEGKFSAKFTISMPDACVNSVQTGGDDHSREVGGDGISFIITTDEEVKGQAGGGIGYYGVDNSIVVELDSFFNGAYCTFATSSTAYQNWGFDNQIYANSSYYYLSNVANSDYTKFSSANAYGQYWEKVLKPNNYSELSGSSTRRFDHVGVMVDGDPHTHLGISYLNGLDPTEVVNGKYVNISNPSASTTSSSADCATRFADAGNIKVDGEAVDNRLFTFWVEYDGKNLYVSYANGNFVEAVRPDSPQISIEGNSAIADKFENEYVKIGFTSAIGSSKANHTVHSVMFVNEYLEEGIENTSYTEKYYVQVDDSASYDVEVNGKKYVLRDEETIEEVALGSSAAIREKSYDGYTEVDYSSDEKYPQSVECVCAEGTTVLYRFYDLNPTHYSAEYYVELENQDTEEYDKIIDGVKYELKETYKVEDVPVDSSAVIVDKSSQSPYSGYELLDETSEYPYSVENIDDNGNTVVYQIYRFHPQYTVKYYTEVLEDTEGAIEVDGKFYVLQEDATVTNRAQVGTYIEYTKSSDDTAGVEEDYVKADNTYKSFDGYSFSESSTKANDMVKGLVSREDVVEIELFYDLKPTFYREQYYVEIEDQETDEYDEIIDGVKYDLELENYVEDVPKNAEATVTDKSEESPFDNYELMDPMPEYPATVPDIDDDGKTIVYQIYRLHPEYVVNYYTEVEEGTEGAVKVGDKYYILHADETIEKSSTTGTVVAYMSEDDKTAGVKEGDKEVTDTFKSFDGFTFSDEATKENGKTTGVLNRDNGKVVIDLFYDMIKADYQEKYWVEVPDATEGYVEIEIGGETKKFILDDTNVVEDITDLDSRVDVTDKSDYYDDYQLVTEEVKDYPSFSEGIEEDGSTVVHQIYVVKPTYEVQYYLEVSEKTDDAIEIEGKYYVIKADETMTKQASVDTPVSVATNENGAGVKETDKEVADTFKSFEGYTFNQTATDINGKNGGNVKSDSSLVVMLMYDLDEVPEEPTTEEPTTEEPTTEEPTTEEPTTEEPTTEETTTEEPTTPEDEEVIVETPMAAPEEPTTEEPTTPEEEEVVVETPMASTGDNSNVNVFIMLLLASCVVALAVSLKRRTVKEQ